MPSSLEPRFRRAVRPARAIALVSLVLVAGCGRAAAPEAETKSAPAAAAAPEQSPLEQAEAELEQARAELEQAALAKQDVPLRENEAAPAPPAAAPAAPAATRAAPESGELAGRTQAREAPKKAAAADLDKGRDDAAAASGAAAETPLSGCERSCKAFGSLKRARDAICRLDEQGGARCSRADGVVRDATSKVQSCGCPG